MSPGMKRIGILLAALITLSSGIALLWALKAVYEPYRGYTGTNKIVLIPRRSNPSEIARQLESQGIIRSATLFECYVRLTGYADSLKAGEYRFQEALNLPSVVRRLHEGLVYYHRVTVPEGLSFKEIITIFVDHGFGNKQQFIEIMSEPELISQLDPEADNLEGYLFPDTYFLTRGMSEKEIASMMVRRFRQIWTPARSNRARELDLALREVVTLASLIEKETAVAEERRLVSAVFHNRLERNLELACDPTVVYAVQQVKEYDGVIHRSDLQLDSPYNTYLYPGLPPGPIANPGIESIDAALYPAEEDYLYFVSKNDGTHHFSNNYRDHHRAVLRYQR